MMSRLAGRWFRSLLILIVVSIVVSGATFSTAQVHSRLEPRNRVEKRLKSFSDDNQIREDRIYKWLAESGCSKPNLSEQTPKFGLPPNVICVVPGETSDVIVVGAHTDKVMRAGDGVVDNWTGASLLPSLVFSLTSEKRHHTFIFVGFTAEERGMIGSAYYVDHLKPEQRAKIAAMVNMDSLGLSPTKVWESHSDKVLLDALASVARATKLPVSPVNVDKVGTTDSESFARYQIPRITLHSVTDDTITVLHSPKDTMSAVKMDDFYDSYRLIAEYLAYLDGALASSRAVEPGKAAQ